MERHSNGTLRRLRLACGVALCLASGTAGAGDYGDAIDAQSEAMREIMRQSAEVDAQRDAFWRNMDPRERYLRSSANSAVDHFRQAHGRYPDGDDRDWLRATLREIGVESRAEAELVAAQMDGYIESMRELDEIGETMCNAGRAWGYPDLAC